MSSSAEELIRHHRYTVTDYYRMVQTGILQTDDRVELIEGSIIDRVPIGSLHGGVVNHLNKLLNSSVGDNAIVSVQNPVRLSDLSEPEPDIALLKPRDDFYASAHPGPQDILLMVEVAQSSLDYDREIKLPLYARHGIAVTWLIDLDAKKIFCYSNIEAERYTSVYEIDTNRPVELPGLKGVSIDLAGLF